MTQRSFRWLFWAFALGGIALDQVSKYGVFRWLYNDGQGDQWNVFPGVFRLVAHFSGDRDPGGPLTALRTLSGPILPTVNQGALFGLGNRWEGSANLIFTVISLVAAVAIVYWSTRRATARDWLLCSSLGLILAGTVGNLYDRVVFDGVRDFLHFYLIDWPVFNVADSCLVCGAILLLGNAFFGRGEPEPAPTAEAAHATAGGAATPNRG
jgi:lipoprotein signal peptidase